MRLSSKVKNFRFGAEAKASINSANKLLGADAKPCDLPMVRMKDW